MIKNFYELDAWKEGRILTREIYACSKGFPKEELFGLSSQMRRSSVSVMENIAEGFGRLSIKEKINFYNQSHGSLTELQSHLFVSLDMKYISENKLNELFLTTKKVQSILQGLLHSTRKRL